MDTPNQEGSTGNQQPFAFFQHIPNNNNNVISDNLPAVPDTISQFELLNKTFPPILQAPKEGNKRLFSDDNGTLKKRRFTDAEDTKKEVPIEDPLVPLLKKRALIAKELLNSEETYCNGLSILCEEFMKPLSSLTGTLISQEQFYAIFPSQLLESILTLTRNLLEELRIRIINWDDSRVLGDVFERVASFFSNFYREYVNNYPRAIEAYQHLMKDHSFELFIMDAQSKPRCNNLDFCAYYITPIQRLPRIKLLLDDLLKNTPFNHPDFHPLSIAVSRVSLANQFINEDPQKKLMSRLRVVQIQDALGVTLHTHLVQPHRHLVYEGQVLLRKINLVNAPPTVVKLPDVESEKNPHLMAIHLDQEDPQNLGDPCDMFLFNDMVVIGKHNTDMSFPRPGLFQSEPQTSSLSLYARIPLESLWCVEHEIQSNQFVLLSPGYRHVFAVPTPEIKAKWIAIIEETCNTYFAAKPKVLEQRKKYSLYKNSQLWAVTAPQYCDRLSAAEYNQQRKNATEVALLELANIMSENEKKRPLSSFSPLPESGKHSFKPFKHKKLHRSTTEIIHTPPGSPSLFTFSTSNSTLTSTVPTPTMPLPQQTAFSNTTNASPVTDNSPIKTPTKNKLLARLSKTISKTAFNFNSNDNNTNNANNANNENMQQQPTNCSSNHGTTSHTLSSIFHFSGNKENRFSRSLSQPHTPEKN
eukprot:TRINITY_DN1565_c0_g1_i3.p1 TRINITY_DN1565_c0_g1~~TRINITY_DN1565_c0_g1_i3.p1  ORF type:complete len:697 (+),score=141.60 TRINITY_DN1565_c0_g1_i3:187-2277(+)